MSWRPVRGPAFLRWPATGLVETRGLSRRPEAELHGVVAVVVASCAAVTMHGPALSTVTGTTYPSAGTPASFPIFLPISPSGSSLLSEAQGDFDPPWRIRHRRSGREALAAGLDLDVHARGQVEFLSASTVCGWARRCRAGACACGSRTVRVISCRCGERLRNTV